MPQVPAILANLVERRLARQAQVAAVQELAPRLRRVRFHARALVGATCRGGDEVEFRVGKTAFRHYTIEAFDRELGLIDVLFFLHGPGAGTRWVQQLSAGMTVSVLGPGKGIRAVSGCTRHVTLGDASALGLFSALMRELGSSGEVCGAIELDRAHLEYPSRAGLSLSAMPRAEYEHGEPLRAWLDFSAPFADDSAFYLVGCSTSIALLRRELIGRYGIPQARMRAKAYWAPGRRGL